MDAVTKREMETILNSTHDGMVAVDEKGVVTLFARALHETKGNRKKAAAVPGISMLWLFYKMGKYGINPRKGA